MDRLPADQLRHSQLERLMHYYHILNEHMPEGGQEHFSSAEVAQLLHMDATQVRKDLAVIGVRGQPRVGFRTAETRQAIAETLGFCHGYRAVLIGAGHLGGALAAYTRFADYGMRLVGIFDQDEEKIGNRFGRLVVQPMSRLKGTVRQRDVALAIISVPVAAAQAVAEVVVEAGVETIWNFAPAGLRLPESVYVRHEHISVGLGELAHHLTRDRDAPAP